MSPDDRRRAARVEHLRRQRNSLIGEARGNLAVHAALVHRTDRGDPIVAASHQQEWCRLLHDRDRFPYVCLVVAPGYGKSYWAIAYASWRIGVTSGRVRLGIVSNTARQAEALSRTIQTTIASPSYRRVYPTVMPDDTRGWSLSQWHVTACPEGPNPTVFASGIGGPMQGRRFDEILLDDPTTWEDARSQTIMDAQRQWLRGTLLQRFPVGKRPPHGKGTRMVVILTRWGQSDLVPTLDELGFRIVRMPAIGYWDRVITCRDCGRPRETTLEAEHVHACEHCGSDADPDVEYGEQPLWPEMEPIEQLLAERENDELIFELVKQGNPEVLSGTMFSLGWFQRGRPPADHAFERIVQFADTAGGKDQRRGDYFAMATVGVLADGTVWILDIDRGRYPAPEQEQAVVRNHNKWSMNRPIDLVCIEDVNEGTALYQRLIRETRLPLKAVRAVHDKTFRAIPMANLYRALKIWHPEKEKWVRTYEAELQSFPEGAHDDMVDAAAGAVNQAGPGPRIWIL
jgi:predicted phage terminase large subunit-like protein